MINRRTSGRLNEFNLRELLHQFSIEARYNMLLPTNLTKHGYTEIDVAFYYKGSIYLIETKNVSIVSGSYYSHLWRVATPFREYSTLNFLKQNDIHMRAFTSIYCQRYNCIPNVQSLIVLPDNKSFPENLREKVYSFTDFISLLSTISDDDDDLLRIRFNLMGGAYSK